MKKPLLLLLLFLLSGQMAWSADESISFRSLGYSNGQSVTVVSGSDFTVTFDKGTNSNVPKYYTDGEAVRVYGGGFFKVESATKTIQTIEISFGSGDKTNEITTDVGSYSSGTWTGSASSVTFAVGGTSGHRRISAISVTYGSSAPSAPSMPTFSPASGATSTTDSPITVTMACATSGATIHYTTDGTTPTASSTQGTSVTFSTAGTHTLKAIAVKNGLSSNVATATYTITQASQGGSDTEGAYVLVTDASTLKAGDKLIIANSHTAGSAYAIANTERTNNRPAASVTITSVNGELSITPTATTEIFNLEGSNDAWSFKAVSEGSSYTGQYLDASGGSSSNYLTYTTTISSASQASISISNSEAAVKFGAERGYLRYNPNTSNNDPIFSCYGDNTSVKTLPSLYRLVTAPDVTVVTGIGNFKQVEPGTTVRLYLPDENNARVLHVQPNGNGTVDAYVRDNTGAILLHGISPNRPLAYNQHLAGWINGQYAANANGVPQFIPDDELTNTAFLVIADPVTEETVEPTEVTVSALDGHLADWVTISEMRMGETGNPVLTNAFNLNGYTAPYAGALVDVSAIVGGAATLYPVSENDVPFITHVIDPAQNFVIPSADINNATIRLKRTLPAGVWTPLTVPFDITSFDGTIMQYDRLEVGEPVTGSVSNQSFDAGNMVFTEASAIYAGVPYLVKPTTTLSMPTFTGVNLHSGNPETVSAIVGGNAAAHAPRRAMSGDEVYAFTGVYSPTTMPTDGTARIMTGNGDIVTANGEQIDGTSAYITAPANQGVHITFEGTSEIITGVTDIHASAETVRHTGIYNMMGMKMTIPWDDLPPGVYIVDGKKVIKTGKEVTK